MKNLPTRRLVHVLVLIAWLANTSLSQEPSTGTSSGATVMVELAPPLVEPRPADPGAQTTGDSSSPSSADTHAPGDAQTESEPGMQFGEELFLGPPPSLVFEDIDGSNWRYPWIWVPLDGWTNSAELGINGSSGNANSFSFQAGARFKRKTDKHRADMRVTHNRTQTNGVEKQHNALLYGDFDRYFGDSPWYLFAKHGVEYDRFKAFDLRYNFSAGLAYQFIKSENLNLKGRFGSGTSREFGGPEDRWVPEALFGGDYEHQLNKRNKWIARADYFPEWGNFSNYRIVSDASWEMLWDETGNLSFKIGAIDRYDSTPNGRQPNDLTYSMLLLYKF